MGEWSVPSTKQIDCSILVGPLCYLMSLLSSSENLLIVHMLVDTLHARFQVLQIYLMSMAAWWSKQADINRRLLTSRRFVSFQE